MKNWKLTVCDALITRLMNLALAEDFPLFQDIYLDALTDTLKDRTRLQRSYKLCRKPLAPVQPICNRTQDA